MRLSVWQLSTVVLLSVLLGQNLPTRPNRAEAASTDVFGSPQVAVASYKNQKGSFILWADGHITRVDTPNTAVSVLTDCVDAPEVPAVTRDNSKPQGSPNVPVGVYQNGTATYLLFADGSYKRPKGDANAPSATHSVRSAQFDGVTGANFGDTSLVFAHGGSPGYYTITFDPPFSKLPTVSVTPAYHHYLGGVMPGSLTKNGCGVWTSMLTLGGWTDANCGFSVTAVGD